MHRPGRSRHVGVRFLPGPFLFHSFSGKIQQSLSDIAVAPPEVLDYNFDLAVRQGGFFTNYLFQFARILAFCFLGEVCHAVLPLPVPASVYGLVLLPIIIAIIPVTVLVMVTAGKTTQALTSRKKNKETAANDGIAE